MEFSHIAEYDDLIKKTPQELQIMVEDYTMALKQKVSPNTVPTMLFGIKAFLEANDIDIKWKKINRLLPSKVKLSGREAWSHREIQSMLQVKNLDLKAIALVLFLSASGVRIGAIPDLKLKHLTVIDNCKMITVYPDTKAEYMTFLTPEASEALDAYLNKRRQDGEYFDQNTPVFRARYQVASVAAKPANLKSLQEIIRHILIKLGLRQRTPGRYQRYAVQIDHGFRKYFNEQIKSTPQINLAYAEKLMGHSVTIKLDDNYLAPKPDKLFDEYQKAIPLLTIDDKQRHLTTIKKLQFENTKMIELEDRLKRLEMRRPELTPEQVRQFLKDNPGFET